MQQTTLFLLDAGSAKKYPVIEEGTERLLHIRELELLFGFPEHYTAVGNLSITARRKLIGRAWSVNVVVHILKPLSIIYSKAS